MLFSNRHAVSFARYLYSKGTNIYIYTLHTRKKVIGINNLARIIGSTHIRVDGWSGEFYIESRGTKSERTKGEYRDAEKGKHFIRFCEIIERERGVCKRRDAKEAATVSEVHEVKNAALHDKREATGGGERKRETRGSLLKRDPRARISLYECIHAASR